MKLEKREITLNEKDSVSDVFYLEKLLLQEYENGRGLANRKEVQNELEKLLEEAKKDLCFMKEQRKKVAEG